MCIARAGCEFIMADDLKEECRTNAGMATILFGQIGRPLIRLITQALQTMIANNAAGTTTEAAARMA